MNFIRFGTKAETLDRLYWRLRTGYVKRPYYFTVDQWRENEPAIVADAGSLSRGRIAVRSSCRMEDTARQSGAGKFTSVTGIDASSPVAVRNAVEKVIASYGAGANGDNHVLVQEMVSEIDFCGVAFTRDLDTMAPYYVISYDRSGSNDSVTSGTGRRLSTYLRYRFRTPHKPVEALERLIRTLQEIEILFDSSKLDVEFAIDRSGRVWILQVRPLASELPIEHDGPVERYVRKVYKKIEKLNRPHIDLLGDRTIFGIMPDWNPAEMIGTKPRPLALSLYKELVTDRVWAYQRDNYGYRNLRSHPLMVTFLGCPYIDTRISFNSFIPKSVPDGTAGKIVNAYLDMLAEHPQSHDKVEFDIVISCSHFEIGRKLREIEKRADLTREESETFERCVRDLTNRILIEKDEILKKEFAKIETLSRRYEEVCASPMTTIEKIYWLVEDCKRYGTLPFAGIARAAFMAVQMMKSLVSCGAIPAEQHEAFMNSLSTISKKMAQDAVKLSTGEQRAAFLKTYGHLRPGTYDILSPRYDEAFSRYFGMKTCAPEAGSFEFPANMREIIGGLLRDNGLETDAQGFIDFVKKAIEGREYAKFLFSRNVSEVLRLMCELGAKYGISVDDLSYVNITTVMNLYASLDALDLGDVLRDAADMNRRAYAVTQLIRMPCLITDAEDVYAFFLHETESNFVTTKRASGRVVKETEFERTDLSEKIVFITSADPGYDWLFSHRIGSLVTMYGGANSHMAIRAAELGLPAVIGCGEKNFRTWSSYDYIEIDCENRHVRELKA